MKYRILSHTADLRLAVYGKTLEKLFLNAAEALADILSGKKRTTALPTVLVGQNSPKEFIQIKASNFSILLVDFLNEILTKSQTNKKLYKINKIIKLEHGEIEAEIVGMPVEKFEEDIKAVTYHEADIKEEIINQKQKIFATKLVFDI